MLRQTARPINPYREFYKKYAETQMTLEEILDAFKDYTIYSFVENTAIYIVDDKVIVLELDSIGYDDEDCVPTLYEAYPEWLGYNFDCIVSSFLEDGIKPTKLN